MSPTITQWIFLNIFFLLMIGLDLYNFHNRKEKVSLKEALGWSFFWIVLAVAFGLGIWHYRNLDEALLFYTGYLVEYSLSIDNLFVFLIFFEYFAVPKALEHKVLFWGILGAIVMRAVFIIFGIALFKNFHWMFYIFGAFLLFTGLKIALQKEKKINPENNFLLKFIRRILPVTDDYDKDHFFSKRNGKWFATPLFVVLIAIESVDILFAVDSIPAILAITLDPFLVYTSNVFAILGLRSLYYPLSMFVEFFEYIKYGLAAILMFIGIKMLLIDTYHVSPKISLFVVVGLLIISLVASMITKQVTKNQK